MGKGKLSVTVTPAMIVQIFAERPHVKRAYTKVMGDELVVPYRSLYDFLCGIMAVVGEHQGGVG